MFLTPDVGDDSPIAADIVDMSCRMLSYPLVLPSIPISLLIALSAYFPKLLFFNAKLNLSKPASLRPYFLPNPVYSGKCFKVARYLDMP